MDEQEKKELMEVVGQQKEFIIKYLKLHNLKVKNNGLSLLFRDGKVDESTIDQQSFVNLWELQFEPSLVKAEFIIERSKEVNSKIKALLESLLNKIVNKGRHDNHRDYLVDSKIVDDYICFKSIQIERQSFDVKIVLFCAIGYIS